MQVTILFTDGEIRISDLSPCERIGARLEFRGMVRDVEQGALIGGLLYEIYQPMAERIIRRIVEELNTQYPCYALHVVHRHGLVPVGETAIYVRVEASHRAEAIKMLEVFMNRLKAEVPIWKSGTVPC